MSLWTKCPCLIVAWDYDKFELVLWAKHKDKIYFKDNLFALFMILNIYNIYNILKTLEIEFY